MLKTRYIHIGYPKTGTTALQLHFFPCHPEVLHLGGRPYISMEIANCVEIDILTKDALSYTGPEVKAKFVPYLAKADSDPKCKALGISAEEFSFSLDGTGADRTLTSVRLKHIFGEAKIIVTIRNQFDFIRSLYSEFIKSGCYFSFKQFLEAHYWRFYTYLFNQIFYYDVFKWYERIFGEGQVKIILFEDFKNDPHKTLNELCSFLGISPVVVYNECPSNPGLSSFSLMMARFFNYIFRNDWGRSYFMPLTPGASTPGMSREINYIPRGILRRDAWRRHLRYTLWWMDRKLNLESSKATFSEEWKERINNLYRENNQRLMEETGLDLHKYNYPL